MSINPVTREDFESMFRELLHKQVLSFYAVTKDVCKRDDLSQKTKDIIKQIEGE